MVGHLHGDDRAIVHDGKELKEMVDAKWCGFLSLSQPEQRAPGCAAHADAHLQRHSRQRLAHSQTAPVMRTPQTPMRIIRRRRRNSSVCSLRGDAACIVRSVSACLSGAAVAHSIRAASPSSLPLPPPSTISPTGDMPASSTLHHHNIPSKNTCITTLPNPSNPDHHAATIANSIVPNDFRDTGRVHDADDDHHTWTFNASNVPTTLINPWVYEHGSDTRQSGHSPNHRVYCSRRVHDTDCNDKMDGAISCDGVICTCRACAHRSMESDVSDSLRFIRGRSGAIQFLLFDDSDEDDGDHDMDAGVGRGLGRHLIARPPGHSVAPALSPSPGPSEGSFQPPSLPPTPRMSERRPTAATEVAPPASSTSPAASHVHACAFWSSRSTRIYDAIRLAPTTPRRNIASTASTPYESSADPIVDFDDGEMASAASLLGGASPLPFSPRCRPVLRFQAADSTPARPSVRRLRVRDKLFLPICRAAAMPKYYCDYCDIFLTHDSAAVRRAHNTGWKHKMVVESYYADLDPIKLREIIDNLTKAYVEAGYPGLPELQPMGGNMRPPFAPFIPGVDGAPPHPLQPLHPQQPGAMMPLGGGGMAGAPHPPFPFPPMPPHMAGAGMRPPMMPLPPGMRPPFFPPFPGMPGMPPMPGMPGMPPLPPHMMQQHQQQQQQQQPTTTA